MVSSITARIQVKGVREEDDEKISAWKWREVTGDCRKLHN